LTDKPQWLLEYSARSEYDLPDLSPSSWFKLVERLSSDESLWNTWWNNFNSQVPNGPCTGSCKSGYLCALGSVNPLHCATNSTIS